MNKAVNIHQNDTDNHIKMSGNPVKGVLLNNKKVVATKFYKWCDSYQVIYRRGTTKSCNDLVSRNRVAAKPIYRRI